jgi:PKD repeat protein/V8-like Glu-specific endopeptidase
MASPQARVAGALLALTLCSCAGSGDGEVDTKRASIIFGTDDRIEASAIASQPAPKSTTFQKVASATAILIDGSGLNCDASGACAPKLAAPSFNGVPLCSDQAFASQQAMAPPTAMADGRNCAAFLVGSNLMVTSGACFGQSDPGLPFTCQNAVVVFGFDNSSTGSTTSIPPQNIYRCKAIVDKQVFNPNDGTFAVFTLDRDVMGRAPLAFRRKGDPAMPTNIGTLAMAGYPLGLPLKITTVGGVTDATTSPDRFFKATLDVETGQSGSPVFDSATGQVEGILTSLRQPRFDTRAGGGPGGTDCLTYRLCSGTCDQPLNADTITRMPFASDNLPKPGTQTWPAFGFATTWRFDANGVRFPPTTGGTEPDTDGDSLPDKWEQNGATVIVNGQSVFVDFPAMGADFKHKDLFVQVDWMERPTPATSFQVPEASMDAMRRSFEAAPVWNPDGEPGIRLHLDAGPGSKTWDKTTKTWVPWPATATATCGTGCIRHAAAVPYSKYFVSSTCDQSNCPTERKAGSKRISDLAAISYTPFGRNFIFEYGIAIDTLWLANSTYGKKDKNPGSTDLVYGATGTTLASGFLTSLGVARPVDDATQAWVAGGNLDERARTTQHELGHTLNLQHYGLDGNPSTSFYKPNYLSAMGYLFQLDTHTPLDYSRHELPPLNESALNESVGLLEPDGRGTLWWGKDAMGNVAKLNTFDGAGSVMPMAFPGAIDWNSSGFGKPSTDPAFQPQTSASADIDNAVGLTTVVGSNDWANLLYWATDVTSGQQGITDGKNGVVVEMTSAQADVLVPLAERSAAAQLPVADVSSTKTGVGAPLTVNFDASKSKDLQGPMAQYRWTFGDGASTTTTGPTVSHVYNTPGNFVAQVTVQDGNGNLSRFPASERVRVDPPLASFIWVPGDGAGTGSSSYAYNGRQALPTYKSFSAGSYELTFPGAASPDYNAGNGGNVLVSAYGSNAHCNPTGWYNSGTDLKVTVSCFGPTGAAVSSRFTASVRRGGQGLTAYVWNSSGTSPSAAPSYSYNSKGGTNSITRSGTGQYTVTMPLVGSNDYGGTVQVSSYDLSTYCQVGGWYSDGTGGTVANVTCFNVNGAYADARFTLYWGLTAPNDAGGWAYAWADQPSAASYTPSTFYQRVSANGTMTISRSAAGQYTVNVPKFDGSGGTNVLVSAYGGSVGYCSVGGWGPSGSAEQLRINCYNGGGGPADSYFTVSFGSSQTP